MILAWLCRFKAVNHDRETQNKVTENIGLNWTTRSSIQQTRGIEMKWNEMNRALGHLCAI